MTFINSGFRSVQDVMLQYITIFSLHFFLLEYLQRSVTYSEYKHWKIPANIVRWYSHNFQIQQSQQHYLESLKEIASLRTYFSSKTYFSEHHLQNLYKVYCAYNLINIYFICQNDSPLAAGGAMNTYMYTKATTTSKTDQLLTTFLLTAPSISSIWSPGVSISWYRF